MSYVLNEVRAGFYLDSVALMRLSRKIAGQPGIAEAALMMGTPANKEILRDAHLLAAGGEAAQGNDLIIGIRADTEISARRGLDHALAALETSRAPASPGQTWRPRSLRAALKSLPDANLALISVPGAYAAAEARKALRRGLHVMIFSDNVPLAEELTLKREARELGRLVMGPDCGTAILNGVPLAFANRVPRGETGLIGASGTGMQEISSLIAQAGGGISQAIGVGGRDLSREIGGISTQMAFDALDADPGTSRIVLISKPPCREVAQRILARAGASGKPVTVCFLGASDLDLPKNVSFAATLKQAAESAMGGSPIGGDFDIGACMERARGITNRRRSITGLFAGGTLCAEAQLVLLAGGRAVASNAPVPGAEALARNDGRADRILDLGADEFTRGRPHPMIDPQVRDDALHGALADANVGVVLLDVVIGYGAHADPAGHLAAKLAARAPTAPVIAASVTGTEQDPQIRSAQVAALESAGVLVAPSNAQAAELALALAGGKP
jgi:FdrA protein